MKQLFYLLLVVVLGACSVGDDEDSFLQDPTSSNSNVPELLVFEGIYSRNADSPEKTDSILDGYIPNANAQICEYTFQIVMYGGNMTFDTQLVEMLTGYKSNGDNLVIPYQLVGSSGDNQVKVFGLSVPPFVYEVPVSQSYTVRLEFGYGSQAVYNTYTGELIVWLEFAKLYRDGVLSIDFTGKKEGFTLLAKRI